MVTTFGSEQPTIIDKVSFCGNNQRQWLLRVCTRGIYWMMQHHPKDGRGNGGASPTSGCGKWDGYSEANKYIIDSRMKIQDGFITVAYG